MFEASQYYGHRLVYLTSKSLKASSKLMSLKSTSSLPFVLFSPLPVPTPQTRVDQHFAGDELRACQNA